MAFSIVIVMFPSTPAPDPASMNYTVVVLAAWLTLCLAYYYCPVYGGVHWFRGPVSNLAMDETRMTQEGSATLSGDDLKKDNTVQYTAAARDPHR